MDHASSGYDLDAQSRSATSHSACPDGPVRYSALFWSKFHIDSKRHCAPKFGSREGLACAAADVQDTAASRGDFRHDFPRIRVAISNVNPAVTVKDDATLERGDFVVETGQTFLDGRVSSQIETIGKVLFDE